MKGLVGWLALPTTLLSVLCWQPSYAVEAEWPYNLPREAKYHPEHERVVKRGLEIGQRMKRDAPNSVRKMGINAGEKFFLEYWAFNGMDEQDIEQKYGNESTVDELRQAVAMHKQHEKRGAWSLFGRDIFARDFRCPAGTESCSSIGSDLCCDSGQSCVKTSEGVGCCPSGSTCGDDIAGCDTAAGYSSCPGSSNGGCCVPGASCLDTGCVLYGTDTVVVAGATSTTTSRPPPSPTSTTVVSDHTEIVVVTISGANSIVTTTIVSATTVTITPAAAPTTCTSGFFSCASSLGGGCCRTGQACATDGCSDRTTSGVTANQPIRPTSSAPSTSTSTSRPPVSGCPTGFYMCSAVYLGGCCRVDRNCNTTSCPATATTDVVKTNGVTVGAGVATADVLTGQCAQGWQTCAASLGGGCCPSAYVCRTESCGATGGGAGTGKVAPSEGWSLAVGWGFVVTAIGIGVGMVWM